MTTISLSPKFQMVIPKAVRNALHLIAGQQLEVRVTDGKIELIPLQPMQAARGLFAGIDTTVPNDDEALVP
ncbi:MAG: AbrB/MazE/SpoVT family DNA-binding domain-containing protein [Rhodoferax sp.]|nr:AbrB/MazE/SpoVT family DNA-binding domain-containing protein [Rhodoferax sp.]